MSTTIDQRVVEMRFDNKHFEQNVQTTMSTLDKLKQKLNLTGASKGLESINSAAKNNNIHMLGAAAEQVGVKFSAMQVAGITAISRLTNQAMAAGEKIVKALTIDPVKTGFEEYETQINAVQTILANTSHNGTTIDQVNDALQQLNEYADKTIYNFTEMTRNIGTFTAAGVDLDTSVSAIQGIANLAAVSGSTSQQASTAMYQLSQALAAGRVSLMDWNSVVNAGMGGKVFQDALIRTSNVMGTGADAAIKKYGSFRESLTKGEWLTTEVLTETLNQFTMAAEEGSKEWEKFKKSLKDKGYSEEQATAILKMANTATSAATEVKTFTQLWDVLKESAQSGWSQTWKLLVGDFEEAKALLSPVADVLTGIINTMSKTRNDILESALGKSFTGLADKIKGITDPVKKSADGVKEVVDSVKDYAKVVDEIIGGKWGNGQARWDALTKAGYDWAHAQNLVNEKLGSSVRHTTNYKEAQNGVKKTQEETTEATAKFIQKLTEKSDAELRAAGYDEKQIKALREIQKQADKTGLSVEEFVLNIDKLDGKWLIVNSFKNIWSGLSTVVKSFGQAWREVFHGDASDEEILAKRADMIYNIIAAIHKFTTYLKTNGEASDKLVRTLKGLLAIVDILTTIFGGGLKIAFKIVTSLLEAFDMNILDVTANIGDAIVAFRDWFDSLFDCSGIVEVLVPILKNAADVIGYFITSVKESDTLALLVKNLKSAIKAIGDWIKGLKNAENIPEYIADGLINGLKAIVENFDSFAKLISDKIKEIPNDIIAGLTGGLWNGASGIIKTLMNLGIKMIEAICNVLGIHSPSTVFIAIGGFIIAGLVLGLTQGFPEIWETIKTLGRTCAEGITGAFEGLQSSKVYGYIKSFVGKIASFIKNLDFGQILAIGLGTGMLFTVNKMVNVIQAIINPLEGLGDMLSGVGEMCEAIGEGVKKYFKSKAMKNYATAVLIMAGAITLIAFSMKTLADIDTSDLVKAGVAIVVITGIVTGLTILVSKLNTVGDFSIKHAFVVIAIAGAVSLLVLALSKLTNLVNSAENLGSTLGVLAGMLLGLGGIVIAINAVAKIGNEANLKGVGSMILKMSIAMLLLVQVIKMVSKLDNGDIIKGLAVIGTLELLFIGIVAVSKLGGEHAKKAGSMMLKMSFALLAMIGVIKVASMLDNNEIKKGLKVVASVELLFMGIIAVSKLAGEHANKAGGMILKMSVALLAVVFVIKQISKMDDGDIKRGLTVVAVLEILFGGLIAVSKLAGEHATKAGTMLLLMSGALLIVSGILYIVSQMPTEGLGRALGIVTVLELLFMGLISATKNIPEKAIGTLIMLIASIGILFAMVIGLTFVDPKKLTTATASISAVIGMFAVLVGSTKYLTHTDKTAKMLSSMVGVVALLALILAGLSLIGNVNTMIPSVASLSLLLLTFTGSLVILSKTGNILPSVSNLLPTMLGITAGLALIVAGLALIKSESAITNVMALSILLEAFAVSMVVLSKAGNISASVASALPVMLGITAGLAVIIGLLALMNVEASINNAISLSVLLNAFSISLVVLSKAGTITSSVITALPSMLGVTAGLAIILGLLALMNVEASLSSAIALGVLLNAFSASLVILSMAGTISPTAQAALIPMLGITAGLALILGLLAAFDVQPSIETAMSISTLLLAFTVALGILTAIGPAAVLADAAMIALGKLVVGVGIVLAALGVLQETFPSLESFLDSGLPLLEKLGYGLGSFVGSIIGGLADGIMSSLPAIGTYLSMFMINAMPFIAGAQLINEQMLAGVSSLAKAILIITAADIINGISSFLGGGESSLSAFGAQLPKLGLDLASFAANLGTFDESTVTTVTCAANAIKALAIAASEIPNEGGWAAKIFGENSIATFGEKLPQLATHLRSFITNLGTFDEATVTTVKCAGNAIKALATAASEIPNDGGWAGKIFGENSISTFGAKLPALGTHLKSFVTNLGTFDEATVSTVGCAGDAIAKLAEAASKIPNEGGWAAKIFGDNSLASFGDQLPTLGTNLKNFATNLGTFDEATVATVDCAGSAIASMAKAASSIDGQPGWAKKLFGDNSLASFGGDMEKLGTNLKNFVSNLGTFTGAQVATVNSAVGAIKAFAKLADADLKSAKKHLTGFSEDLPTLASDIADFCGKMPGSDSITTAKTNVSKLVDMIGELASAKSSEAVTFTNNLKKLADDVVKKFVKALTSESAKSDVKKAGVTLIEKVIDGVESKKKSLNTAFGDAVKGGPKKIKEYKDDFSTAGKALCTGLANGIKNNQGKAVAAAEAMAKAVKNAAKEALKINSPSKVFVAIGSGVIEGFVKGIDDNMGYTTTAVTDMADTAKNGFGKAISSITGLLDGSMEMQPTIRPVLDLSNVKSGAASINGMLNNQSVGISSNINAISNMMNQRNQNGTNNDIVSAVDRLYRKLDNVGGNTTYNVNGITYDDGSNVSNAISALIRAANLERRI